MSPAIAVMKVWQLVKNQGVKETANVIRANIVHYCWEHENERFDRMHNVDTGGSIEATNLNIDSANRAFGVRYEPTSVKTFTNVMANLPPDVSDFTFVDFGSGKGRVLLLASHYGFRKIVGVEYAKDLHDIAQKNIRSYCRRGQRCLDIESVLGDASTFPIPSGPCVFYFFQPFTLDVMAAVLRNIKQSLAAQPRKIFLVLLHPHPFALETIERLSFVRRIDVKPLSFDWAWMYPRDLALYSNDSPMRTA